MSTKPKSSSKNPSVGQQRRKASILLLRLQWLFFLLFIIALVGLYVSQQRFQNQVKLRLQNNEQVISRLNEMDDRLFAISQQAPAATDIVVGSQAQNQLDLLRIQMQAVNSLLMDDNYKAAIDLLRGLQWQLSQSSNEIAPALTIIIKQSLEQDIERLQAQSAQPSSWQLQNLAIQNIQTFLHSHKIISSPKLNNSPELNNSSERNNSYKTGNSTQQLPPKSTNGVLTHQQLTVHEVIMTLNLAMQASNMREQDQLSAYLRQARKQLQTLNNNNSSASDSNTTTSQQRSSDNTITAETKRELSTRLSNQQQLPNDIPEVITWLDELIAHAPTPTSLLTTQVLEQPQPE